MSGEHIRRLWVPATVKRVFPIDELGDCFSGESVKDDVSLGNPGSCFKILTILQRLSRRAKRSAQRGYSSRMAGISMCLSDTIRIPSMFDRTTVCYRHQSS